jgi:ABC-2 type transport system ATP-binding protein
MPHPLSLRCVTFEAGPQAPTALPSKVLDRISFVVREGEIVVLVGSPASGKTTLCRIIVSLLEPSSGDVVLFGLPGSDWAWKEEVGYLPQVFQPRMSFTAESYLRHIGRLRGVPPGELEKRVCELLEQTELGNTRQWSVGDYSRGVLGRLGLAQALVHRPRLLILDEPMRGLAAWEQHIVRALLWEHKLIGGSAFICTRSTEGLETLSDRCLVIECGGLRTGPPQWGARSVLRASAVREESLYENLHGS